MSVWPFLPSCDRDHLSAQVGMSCGLPIFPSCMLPRSHCQGPGVLGQLFGVSFWLVPFFGTRSFLPLSCYLWVKSRWSFHKFCVVSSYIDFPYSICGGTSLYGTSRKFPWVRRLQRKHRAAFPLNAVLPCYALALSVRRSGLWWIAIPDVGFACEPSGFLLILRSSCGHLSL